MEHMENNSEHPEKVQLEKTKTEKNEEHPDDETEKNDTTEVTVLKLDKQSEEYVEEYSDKTNENEQIIVEAVVHKNLEENKCEKCEFEGSNMGDLKMAADGKYWCDECN